MKRTTIDIPIYFGKLTIIQTDDFKALEKEFDLRDTGSVSAFCFRQEENKYVVVIPFKTTNSIIAHECVHLTNFIFTDCYVELDLVNDEPQAYMLGWLFDEIEKFFNQ